MRKSDQQHHSTFFVQSLFFLLVFVENMLLASWPLIKGRVSDRMSCEESAMFPLSHANIPPLCACHCRFLVPDNTRKSM